MRKTILLLIAGLFLLVGVSIKAENNLRERIYLQTDKTLYLAGELLWMKLFTTDEEGKPLDLSKVAYIEILDETTAQVQVKLEIDQGVGEGWLSLPVTLPTGNYRLVAYTRYMQNEGEEIFFSKVIPVVNTFTTDGITEVLSDAIVSSPFKANSNGQIILNTDKSTYSPRSVAEIQLKNIPEDIFTLSVSVAGRETQYSTMDILQWDNLRKNAKDTKFAGNMVAEYEGHILSARMIDLETGEPVRNIRSVPLLAFPGKEIRLFEGQSQEDASVLFFTKHISGMHEIVTATLPRADEKCRVDIVSPFVDWSPKKLPALQLDPTRNDEFLERSVGLQILHAYMADSLSQIARAEIFFRWEPDRKYLLDEYTRFSTMEEMFIEFIPALRFRKINNKRVLSVMTEDNTGYAIGNSLILLDGIPITDHEFIYKYNPYLLKEVEVYKGRYVLGEQMFNGIAFLKSYNTNYPELTLDGTTQFFDYEGTQPHRFFYVPSYNTNEQKESRTPDYRHTLFWNPFVQVNESSSLNIPFTTSDIKGEFVVTVEGITDTGQIIYETSLIKVE